MHARWERTTRQAVATVIGPITALGALAANVSGMQVKYGYARGCEIAWHAGNRTGREESRQ